MQRDLTKSKAVIDGSDFTIMHNELALGETVNFKVALKDIKQNWSKEYLHKKFYRVGTVW